MRILLPISEINAKTYIYEASHETVISSIPYASIWFALNSLFQYENVKNMEIRTYNRKMDINYKFDLPFIKRTRIESFEHECIISNIESIISYIENVIMSGKYLYSHFEQYYIPGLKPYNKYRFSHDFIAYGYDSDKKELYILTYTENNIFEPLTVKYENLIHAFQENTDTHMFLECEPIDVSYQPKLSEIYSHLSIYCNLITNADNINFNMGTYNTLVKFILCGNIDLRSFRFFYERKQLLFNLVAFIEKQYNNLNLENETYMLSNVKQKTKLVFMLLLKNSLKESDNIKMRVIKLLKESYTTEKFVLDSLLNKIEKEMVGINDV